MEYAALSKTPRALTDDLMLVFQHPVKAMGRRPSGRDHSIGRAQALRAIPRGQRSVELRLIRAEGAERPWMPLRTQTA
jgi:hypothetical protein